MAEIRTIIYVNQGSICGSRTLGIISHFRYAGAGAFLFALYELLAYLQFRLNHYLTMYVGREGSILGVLYYYYANVDVDKKHKARL